MSEFRDEHLTVLLTRKDIELIGKHSMLTGMSASEIVSKAIRAYDGLNSLIELYENKD